ncbi:MAG: histidine utilization repressor [Alphaproteobacteria bacterium]|nr:MAG: histidine utilization repressor [Alphaproteobacteria bacterium]
MNTQSQLSDPLYLKVKKHILEQIRKGVWGAADRIPSENALIEELGASKMTVNRALREMAQEGHLIRIVGVGSFVAESKVQVHPLEIRNIADEIAERGHVHSARVEHLAEEKANQRLAEDLGIAPGAPVFHSVILHLENDEPLQLEDRYVNPAAAPDYMSCDFTQVTPAEYLMKVAPLQEVEHIVEAQMPSSYVARLLELQPNEPCLVVTRRTWALGHVASGARLYHPGSTYRVGGRFSPATPPS